MAFDDTNLRNTVNDLQKIQEELNAGKTAAEELRQLTRQLHAAQRHPEYEYDYVETRRKSGDDHPPEGFGWELNEDFNDGGCVRDDHTDTYFYRRLKSDAAKDGISPYKLNPIVLPPVELAQYLALLREHVGKGYMPSANHDRMHSKPEYEHGFTKRIQEGKGVFHFTGFFCDEDLAYEKDRPIWAYVQTDKVELFTNLTSELTYVRVRQPHSVWHEWYPTVPININFAEVKEVVDVYL